MLRACSFTLALASRNEGLTAAVERDRVKVREVEALGADDARIFTAVKDMTESAVQVNDEKNLELSMSNQIHDSNHRICASPIKSDQILFCSVLQCGLALSRALHQLFAHQISQKMVAKVLKIPFVWAVPMREFSSHA